MKNKEYYIDLFETHFISFNEYWEDPIEHSELRDNTEETIDLIETYLKILKTKQKTLNKNLNNMEDYNLYPASVKEAIDNIIKLVSDGRDLWHEVEYHHCKGSFINNEEGIEVTKKYDHHVAQNGHLSFENEPWIYIEGKLSQIEELREILNSEKSTVDFRKYINGKWYLFEGYENGSISVRFRKINKTKNGKYTFDGDLVNWATIDSRYDGDGIIFNTDCENVSFSELPYCDGEFENDEELMEFIDSCEQVETDEEIKKSIRDCIESYLEDLI